MKKIILGLIMIIVSVSCSFAQSSTAEQEIIKLSKDKWQWMADKNVDKLASLFHDQSKFVHMSGTWKKDEELWSGIVLRLSPKCAEMTPRSNLQ